MISQLRGHNPKTPAIVSCDEGRVLSYEELLALVERNQGSLSAFSPPLLALLYCQGNTLCEIVFSLLRAFDFGQVFPKPLRTETVG